MTKDYEKILQEKIDYYGETKAAYQFAAEEYARQEVKKVSSPQSVSDEEIERAIYSHLENLPYDGGYPWNWQETLAKSLNKYFNPRLTVNNEWVEVSERLPKIGEVVLVYCESQGVQMCYLNVSGKWLMHYDSSRAYMNITKWMPLPPIPQTKK